MAQLQKVTFAVIKHQQKAVKCGRSLLFYTVYTVCDCDYAAIVGPETRRRAATEGSVKRSDLSNIHLTPHELESDPERKSPQEKAGSRPRLYLSSLHSGKAAVFQIVQCLQRRGGRRRAIILHVWRRKMHFLVYLFR